MGLTLNFGLVSFDKQLIKMSKRKSVSEKQIFKQPAGNPENLLTNKM